MKTPICDFVNEYVNKKSHRLHVPGHKGSGFLGVEKYDITETKLYFTENNKLKGAEFTIYTESPIPIFAKVAVSS